MSVLSIRSKTLTGSTHPRLSARTVSGTRRRLKAEYHPLHSASDIHQLSTPLGAGALAKETARRSSESVGGSNPSMSIIDVTIHRFQRFTQTTSKSFRNSTFNFRALRKSPDLFNLRNL
jgi:hypothetical protein